MPKLYIVPTPIGNLEDVTFRALRILKEADYVLAEDTRTSRKFFNHYEISTPLRAYHMHNEHAKLPALIEQLQKNMICKLNYILKCMIYRFENVDLYY